VTFIPLFPGSPDSTGFYSIPHSRFLYLYLLFDSGFLSLMILLPWDGILSYSISIWFTWADLILNSCFISFILVWFLILSYGFLFYLILILLYFIFTFYLILFYFYFDFIPAFTFVGLFYFGSLCILISFSLNTLPTLASCILSFTYLAQFYSFPYLASLLRFFVFPCLLSFILACILSYFVDINN
jgi:hypothetical protein